MLDLSFSFFIYLLKQFLVELYYSYYTNKTKMLKIIIYRYFRSKFEIYCLHILNVCLHILDFLGFFA